MKIGIETKNYKSSQKKYLGEDGIWVETLFFSLWYKSLT